MVNFFNPNKPGKRHLFCTDTISAFKKSIGLALLSFHSTAMDAYNPYHEKELLQKLAQGDEAAFTQLFHAYEIVNVTTMSCLYHASVLQTSPFRIVLLAKGRSCRATPLWPQVPDYTLRYNYVSMIRPVFIAKSVSPIVPRIPSFVQICSL